MGLAWGIQKGTCCIIRCGTVLANAVTAIQTVGWTHVSVAPGPECHRIKYVDLHIAVYATIEFHLFKVEVDVDPVVVIIRIQSRSDDQVPGHLLETEHTIIIQIDVIVKMIFMLVIVRLVEARRAIGYVHKRIAVPDILRSSVGTMATLQ